MKRYSTIRINKLKQHNNLNNRSNISYRSLHTYDILFINVERHKILNTYIWSNVYDTIKVYKKVSKKKTQIRDHAALSGEK